MLSLESVDEHLSNEFKEGDDFGFKHHHDYPDPYSTCPYRKGTLQYNEWIDGYFNGRKSEILTGTV